MQRMARSLVSRVWRLIDQHSVHCHYVGPAKVFGQIQNLWIFAILKQLLVQVQVLKFVDCIFVSRLINEGDIFLDSKSRNFLQTIGNVAEALPKRRYY